MNLIHVKDKHDKKDFIKFYKDQYINSPKKRDSLSRFLKNLLNEKSQLNKSVDLEALMVTEEGNIIMICILAHAQRMDDILQISFFESSKYSPDAFQLILDRAEASAREKKASKISASLNIHVNYGLGFLASNYEENQSFGMAHNPDFYNLYFKENNFQSIELVSYKKEMAEMDNLFTDNMKKRLNKRYRVREIDFKNFDKEIKTYTDINNKAFKDHLFYYQRKHDEDMELFKDLKFLLKEENLLFVERDGLAVGFMLWYPDFNELVKEGKSLGIWTVVKNKLGLKSISTFKIVEIGILPSERDKGAILALFDYCFQCVKGKYKSFESSWILKDNDKSKGFGIKWADGESKEYRAYIKEIDNDKI